ncbi:MAG: LysM peptidoglycan-binding domain-containing protein [Acidimicrobiales bacterium]
MATAMLICKFPIPGEVTLDFNPDQVTVSRSSANKNPSTSGAGGTSPSILKWVPPESLKITNAWLDGDDVQDKATELLNWMAPKGGFLGAIVGALASAAVSALGGPKINLATKRPQLTFTWGSGFLFECQLTACTVNYVRFSSSGTPTRAKLSQITLEKVPSILDLASMGMMATNPTSGGAPGRRSHIITSGENLQHIATRNYGNPRHWRALADNNGIDDPLRIKPGQHIYLPNVEEMIGS